jgi:hypothetical protein
MFDFRTISLFEFNIVWKFQPDEKCYFTSKFYYLTRPTFLAGGGGFFWGKFLAGWGKI